MDCQPPLQNRWGARHAGGLMRTPYLPLLTVAAALLAAAPALAASYDKVFFVKRGATAAAMFEDRDACTKVAEGVMIGRSGQSYSDPDYGVLSAMGAALDADYSNGGGVQKAVSRAALEKCMEKRGWTQRKPNEDQEKAVRKASRKDPSALDAWLKANEPAEAPPPATAVANAAPPTLTIPPWTDSAANTAKAAPSATGSTPGAGAVPPK